MLEESGIAGGIHRIVAVTGQAAIAAYANAVAFEMDYFVKVRQMPTSIEKEEQRFAISILKKKSLMLRLKKVIKDMLKEQRVFGNHKLTPQLILSNSIL